MTGRPGMALGRHDVVPIKAIVLVSGCHITAVPPSVGGMHNHFCAMKERASTHAVNLGAPARCWSYLSHVHGGCCPDRDNQPGVFTIWAQQLPCKYDR